MARAHHRQGLGRRLFEARLAYLRAHYPEARALWVNTSQRAEGFFRRFGFVTQTVTEDAFAPGLHEYRMALELSAPERSDHAR